MDPIVWSPAGLHIRGTSLHIDPVEPVQHALLTHAHADHAVAGCGTYWCAAAGIEVARKRLPDAEIRPVEWDAPLELEGTRLTWHPAGHVLGSAQIRVQRDQTWVVSGDYKRLPDPTCAPFAVVPCDGFISEGTFALPIYRWPPVEEVVAQIRAWWAECIEAGRTAVLFAYSLGKAQRVLAELAREPLLGPIVGHGAICAMNEVYERSGVALPPVEYIDDRRGKALHGHLVMAPPSVRGGPWMRRFSNASLGYVSGWMRVRGQRRRRSVDRGFVLSDHADWPALLRTIEETGAQKIRLLNGATALARHLREQGVDAEVIQ